MQTYAYYVHEFHRLYLAALHYNHNSGRVQAITRKGEKRYNIIFLKYKKGGHVVRQVKTPTSYG